MNNNFKNTEKRMAKITGISLVIMAVVAGFGYGFAFNQIYQPNESALTIANLNSVRGYLMVTILCFTVVLFLDFVLCQSMYLLFKNQSQMLSLLSSCLRLIYSVILAIAINSLISIYMLPLKNQEQIDIIIKLFENFLAIWSVGLIVFGLHLIVLGILMYRIASIPKLISILVLFAGISYFGSNILNILVIDYHTYKETVDLYLSLPMALGELSLAIWLLMKYK